MSKLSKMFFDAKMYDKLTKEKVAGICYARLREVRKLFFEKEVIIIL